MYPVLRIASTIADQTAIEPAMMSLWELACAGGWIMIVFLFLSLVVIYIFIAERIELRKVNRPDDSLIARIGDYLQMGRKDSAIALCKERNTSEAHMVEKRLRHLGQPISEALPATENIDSYGIGRLERGLPLLATIAAEAPVIGFLNTVTGMVQAFFGLVSVPGGIDVSLLSGGIYQALVTAVDDLIVGIATLFLYNCLAGQINRITSRLEASTLDFMGMINEL